MEIYCRRLNERPSRLWLIAGRLGTEGRVYGRSWGGGCRLLCLLSGSEPESLERERRVLVPGFSRARGGRWEVIGFCRCLCGRDASVLALQLRSELLGIIAVLGDMSVQNMDFVRPE